jgi:uncharacterized protein (UPF0548 family)
VFTVRRPTAAQIEKRIVAAAGLPAINARFLSVDGRKAARLPSFFSRDFSTTVVGRGEACFVAARRAFEGWAMFDLGWVRVANPQVRIVRDQLIVAEAYTLGLWTVNISRVVDFVDKPGMFGFVYATTEFHVEEGEERFLLELDSGSEAVGYTVEAISRPRSNLARIGWPITRMFQHRFARDSSRLMRDAVASADTLKA